MSEILLFSGLAIFSFMVVMFSIAQAIKDNSIVDIGWGTGFVIVAVVSLLVGGEFLPRQLLMTGVVALWGLRLTVYLFQRNVGKPEDYRYVQMRKRWEGNVAINAFFKVFMLQGTIMYIVALPIMMVASSKVDGLNALDIVGLLLFLIGFYFEAVGDYQKSKFKKNPANAGKIMQTGLWKYTRHPNYFGDSLMWWSIFLIAASAGWWYISFIGPFVMTFFLINVSGIAMLERRYKGNQEFADYASRTNAFFPWFPKKKEANSNNPTTSSIS